MGLRCKLSGCDLDGCGVCKRCGSKEKELHDWQDAERERACFELKKCSRCDAEKEKPDHDWQSRPGIVDEIELACARCGIKI